MKKTIYEDYEQMNIGSIDSRTLGIPTRKRGYCTKKRVLFLLCFLTISITIIFFIFRKPKKSSDSSEPNNNTNTNTNSLENELNALTTKENELRNENNKLSTQRESLQKENEKMTQQINELMEEKKKQNDKNNDISKELSEKEEKIKELENKLKESKNKYDELSKQEKEQNEKLNENNSKIKSLEQKIEELEKELKGNESSDKKEEEKKEEEKKEEDKKEKEKEKEEEKKEEDKKEDDKKEDDKKEEDKKEEDKEQEINPEVKSRINSKIIVDPKYLDILDKWFRKELRYKLLYRATDEQYSAEAFHNLVDKIKNTIIFIKDVNNFIYGGFTRKTWDGKRVFKTDQNAIVFNLDKEIYYKINDPSHAIFCDPDNLAIFGEGDILLGKKSIESSFPKTYGSKSENKKNELTLGFDKLSPLEIEVFNLS